VVRDANTRGERLRKSGGREGNNTKMRKKKPGGGVKA